MADGNSVPAVEVRGVGKRFGDHEVLSKIDLRVMRGETVCILGPSGSGKSTLLPCINWLERPDWGQIFLHGENVGVRRAPDGSSVPMTDRELAAVRMRVGMVFQHFNLWPHMTALGHIIECPFYVQRSPRHEVVYVSEQPLNKVS